MKRKITLISIYFLFALGAKAQWVADTNVCNVICNVPGTQYQPDICSDGHNGAIMCWTDFRNSRSGIYAQHIDSAGYIQWAVNGIDLTDTSAGVTVSDPAITSDGAGGAIICYSYGAGPQNHTYAIRVNSSGNAVWPYPVAIDTVRDSRLPGITSDNNGGAIINWYAYPTPDIFVQWIDGSGATHLPANGLQVTSGLTHYHSHVAYAGDSTAYVAYCDNDTLRITRFDSTGTIRWNTPATLTNSCLGMGNDYALMSNNNHDALVAWNDGRVGAPGFYAQRIDKNENQLWNTNGNPVDTSGFLLSSISLTDDGANGMLAAYGSGHLKVQRIAVNGQNMFTPAPVLCSAGGQYYPVILRDGSNGAIIVWQDARGSYGVYAQRTDMNGNLLWRDCGVPVYTVSNGGTNNYLHATANTNATGIAVFLYSQTDVYCSKVDNPFATGLQELTDISSLELFPNPVTNELRIQNEELKIKEIEIYNVLGEEVYSQQQTTNNKQQTVDVSQLPSGIYFVKVRGEKGDRVAKFVKE